MSDAKQEIVGDLYCVEVCFCEYETGYQVFSIHRGIDSARIQATKFYDENKFYDGVQVMEWDLLDING